MPSEVWTVKEALDWIVGYLDNKQIDNPRLSAQWLLSHATGLSRIEVYANFDKPLSMQERNILRDGVRRRASNEPLQYIVGEVGFRHIVCKVRKGVLIPRPETEVAVSELLREIGNVENPNVLDLCTGSGCIALSIACEHPSSHVVATDISSEAIALAEENAAELGVADRVEFIECDLACGVPSYYREEFDAIISNPPYIPTEILKNLPDEVSEFEPKLALDGGFDGLDVFRRIIATAADFLKPKGILVVELFEESLDAASEIAGAGGYDVLRLVNDMAGRPRVIVCVRKE